jgi:hypothetical protein
MLFRVAGTVRVSRQKVTLEDAIGFHACSLEANPRVTNGIPLGSSLLLLVCTVNCVQTLKASKENLQDITCGQLNCNTGDCCEPYFNCDDALTAGPGYGARFTLNSAELGLRLSGCDCCKVRIFGRNPHSRMPLIPMPLLRMKLLQTCDQ